MFAALAVAVAEMEERFRVVRIEAQRLAPGLLGGRLIDATQNLAQQIPGGYIAGRTAERERGR